MQSNKARMAGWLRDKDGGKMISQAPRQCSLFLHLALCSSADLLISAAHGWHAAAGAAPWACDTSLSTPITPALGIWVATSQAQKNHPWKSSSASPSPGLFPLCVLPSAMILAPLCLLTSPTGSGSCLSIIILFSWWSALISSPQLVLDPEAKGKHTVQNHSRVFWHA